jgi:hypothetical protein
MNQSGPWGPTSPPIANSTIADVRAPRVGEGSQVTFTFPIHQPEGELSDFQVGVRASVLKRCRERLRKLATHQSQWGDLLLGMSTLAAGAFLSALTGDVSLSSWRGVLFYCLSPVVAVGTGVAFIFLRKSSSGSVAELTRVLLEDLPDPDHTKAVV